MKKIIIAASLIASASAQADEWTGKDKMAHAIAGAAVGSAVTVATSNPHYGCAAALIVGAAKEAYDSQHQKQHTASFKDFAVTALAGCAAAGVTGLVITPRSVTYSVAF